MDCYINHIVIFNREGEKRSVSFQRGLNIITGDSKTGKSALIEIVDYCLCSKTSSIPQGRIADFGFLFVIVLRMPDKFLVIGRKSYTEGGNSHLYVKLEVNEDIVNKLDLPYFERINPHLKSEAQEHIERNLGLSVSNISKFEEVDSRKNRKASLREMTSFLFQHQNLLANKHALFYRFDDYYKRQAVIDSFPVFAGWADDEYFSLRRELEVKEKQLRQLELSQKRREQAKKLVEEEIVGYFRTYYSLLGLPFEMSLSFTQLVAMKDKLPTYSSKTFTSENFSERYNLVKYELEENSARHKELEKKIRDLEETERFANEFQVGLKTLKLKSASIDPHSSVFDCPICGKENDILTEEMLKIDSAKEQLVGELKQLQGYAVSYQKEIDKLKKEQMTLQGHIKNLNTQKLEIEKIDQSIKREKNLSEQVVYAKAQLELRLDLFDKEREIVVSDETTTLKTEIELIKESLKRFNVNDKYKSGETFLGENMNKIGNQMDFEEQLKPLQFWFDLNDFSFSQDTQNAGKISLGEMGSGANWLTCHISLFLSLLHYFAIQKKSVIPSFLFLDQPSQVYFPSSSSFAFNPEKDNDIRQVERIYLAILKELNDIEKDAGFLPQIIVTDHADNLDLAGYEFNKFVRKRWKPEFDGALI